MNTMGVIASNNREIRFYYSSASSIGKQVRAYIMASDKKVLTIDVCKTSVTGTQWVALAHGLGIQVQELIDVAHPDFHNQYGKGLDLQDVEDWLKVLQQSPEVLNFPILANGNHYTQLKSPAEAKQYLDQYEELQDNRPES